MDQTTNSDYLRFDRQGGGDSSGPEWNQPADPPESQGGGETANAELPGVTQQTPSAADVPPGGDRSQGGS